jgi:hypothetical protein
LNNFIKSGRRNDLVLAQWALILVQSPIDNALEMVLVLFVTAELHYGLPPESFSTVRLEVAQTNSALRLLMGRLLAYYIRWHSFAGNAFKMVFQLFALQLFVFFLLSARSVGRDGSY